MFTARLFATSHQRSLTVSVGRSNCARRCNLVTAAVSVLLLLLTVQSALPQSQTDLSERPRRTQLASDQTKEELVKTPSPEAIAEAKRLYKAGVKYGVAGLYKQAAANFEQAVKLNPAYADAYFSLGHAYSDLGQWEQAINSLERGLTLKPGDKDGKRRLEFARSMLQRDPGQGNTDGNRGQAEGSHASLSAGGLPAKPSNDLGLTKIYRIGPGDVLEVRLTQGALSQPTLHTVTPAGLLEHPELSAPLPSAGLTVEEITARIENDVKRRSSRNVTVTVTVNEYASHTILVSGLVKEPGVKIIKREAIPLYVVVADAQALPEADSVNVLRHDSNESYVIELANSAEMSMLVRPRDVVTLQANPPQFFYVSGEVKSPGEKSFRRGLTLTQAIIAAGGLSSDSKEARLARDNGTGYLVNYRFKLKDINSGKAPDPTILPGDRITIVK